MCIYAALVRACDQGGSRGGAVCRAFPPAWGASGQHAVRPTTCAQARSDVLSFSSFSHGTRRRPVAGGLSVPSGGRRITQEGPSTPRRPHACPGARQDPGQGVLWLPQEPLGGVRHRRNTEQQKSHTLEGGPVVPRWLPSRPQGRPGGPRILRRKPTRPPLQNPCGPRSAQEAPGSLRNPQQRPGGAPGSPRRIPRRRPGVYFRNGPPPGCPDRFSGFRVSINGIPFTILSRSLKLAKW